MYDLVALGELLIDFVQCSVSEQGVPVFSANPGGAPANLVCAAQSYGAATAFVGKVGDDQLGAMLVDTLNRCGVATAGVVRDSRVFTTLAFVSLDQQGDRHFSFARKPGADCMLTPQEVDKSLLQNARIFHYGSLSMTSEPVRSATIHAIETARENGALLSFDPNLRENLWDTLDHAKEAILYGLTQADFVKISQEELFFVLGDGDVPSKAQELVRRFGLRLAAVTMGKDGCYYCTPQFAGQVPSPSVKPIDTTGAGDIFTGALLSRLLHHQELIPTQEEPLRKAVAFAVTAASLSTLRHGGIPSIPPVEDILYSQSHREYLEQ